MWLVALTASRHATPHERLRMAASAWPEHFLVTVFVDATRKLHNMIKSHRPHWNLLFFFEPEVPATYGGEQSPRR